MKCIDTEKLKAEIERRKQVHFDDYFIKKSGNPADYGASNALAQILSLINSLQQEQPSLPSNLDEAAEEYADYNSQRWHEDGDVYYDHSKIMEAFKAGAEWMAGQGVILNLSIDELSCGAYNACVEQGLTSEDDVIIQIRKKEK